VSFIPSVASETIMLVVALLSVVKLSVDLLNVMVALSVVDSARRHTWG
jgi:hypothetical protein